MKKHLIAAAVATAVAVPAMAQNVTVFGVLDVGYGQSKVQNINTTTSTKTTDSGTEGQASGNRIGFRGTEDLGGGLKAGFMLEMSHTPTETGSGVGTTNRQSFVSLSGGFGEVAIGRFNTLTKVIQDSNTFGGPGFGVGWTTQLIATDTVVTGAASEFTGLNAERISNAIQYKTPTFSGVSASIQLADNTTDASNVNGEASTGKGTILGLNYAAGPLALAVAVKDLDSRATEASTSDRTAKHTAFLATYDFGAAKVFFVRNDASNQAEGATLKAEYTDNSIGVRIPLGNLALLAQYSDGEYESAASPAVKTDLKGYQLGAQYSLSKRTTAYAYYGDDEAKRTGVNKAERSGFALGIRHTF